MQKLSLFGVITSALVLASCAGIADYKQQQQLPLTEEPAQTVQDDGAVLNSQNIDYGKEYKAYYNPDKDPYQKFNRWAFNVNMSLLDRYFLRPVAVFNNKVVSPDLVRALVNLDNYLDEPFAIVFNAGTGQFKESRKNFLRLAINGIFGLGMLDWASEMGINSNGMDLDYFLAYYNIAPGSYIIIPGYNATTTRKLIAKTGVQSFASSAALRAAANHSLTWYTFPLSIYSGIVARGNLIAQEGIIFGAKDRYATFRSVWLQNYSYNQSKATGKPQPVPAAVPFDDSILDKFN